MMTYDLTNRIAPYLDRHLVFPLLEFLQERQLYADDEMLKAKMELVCKTNVVDYEMETHQKLYHTQVVPQAMVDRKLEVLARVKSSKELAAPLISFLNSSSVQMLRPDKEYNFQMLNDRFQIVPEQIEALYQYAKLQFECGFYFEAADALYLYCALCTNPGRGLSATWGKLAAEILTLNWDIALEELNHLKEIIDMKNFASPLTQLQNRVWLMHWSLFVFFNHENGRKDIIDLFFQDRYMNAIQTSAPHLLRYVATAVVVNKRRSVIKELTKVIQQEQHTYRDPITEFLECLYVYQDFDGAQRKLHGCEDVILNDPFLGKCVSLKDKFLENAHLLTLETYCQIHQCIDIGILAEKLNMSYDEVERWIVNFVQSAKIDAKIDSESGTIMIGSNHVNRLEQVIENMKQLSFRTFSLAKNVCESETAAAIC